MTPFRFGPPQQQLFGIHHPAAPGRAAAGGVLICNPFGQEAVRTHRLFRVLADRLSKAGLHVLRFDYLGTGEADGDDLDGNLEVWRDNVLLAHKELDNRSMGAPIRWLGARLGATLASLAAERAPDLAHHLILWEPVTDGSAYFDGLSRDHLHALKASYGLVPRQFREAPRGELLGFEVSGALDAQVRALTPASLSSLHARRVSIVAAPGARGIEALAAGYRGHGAQVDVQTFEHRFEWASEEALNTALVPQDAIRTLAQLIDPDA